jgi:superfamily II DNA or RNA helicase
VSFTDIIFPPGFEYSSDSANPPIEFFLEVIPKSREIYLLLGYFSSKAIRTLSFGFAPFIYNGGKIKIVTNHFLYKDDQKLLGVSSHEEASEPLGKDLEWLHTNLSDPNQKHFINCLKLLRKSGQLEIIPVMLKPKKMVHYKEGLFFDEGGKSISIDGSCNFTGRGLLENGESFGIHRSWGSDFERNKTDKKFQKFEPIFDKTSSKFIYLSKEEIEDAIDELGEDKDINELLIDEIRLVEQIAQVHGDQDILQKYRVMLDGKIKSETSKPKFPFESGPHDYQLEARHSWREAGKKGIFAMATGTGKTITALNCLLLEYQELGTYQAIILVPSELLLLQWGREAQKFNFRDLVLVSSKQGNWRGKIKKLHSDLIFNKDRSFLVITTYASFVDNVQLLTEKMPQECLFIADEVHNVGATRMRSTLPEIYFEKRIGLSATPKRDFDEVGNLAIESFFESEEPYTYSFSMARAIDKGFLCPYRYYPHVVYLNDEEMEDYEEISTSLAKLYHGKREDFNKDSLVKNLLLKRKRIIHKAVNKLAVFKSLVRKELQDRGELNYTFVYVPEGIDEEDNALIDSYMIATDGVRRSLRLAAYTQNSENKKETLVNFERGTINMLFAMKCLDEGVDIPRTELAIFCSSTGTPRQFVQRRGRVIRTHPEKEIATIHDLVVFPNRKGFGQTSALESKFVKSELTRVVQFASLASNYNEAMDTCNEVAMKFDVDVYALQYELEQYEIDLYGSADFEEGV